ncbi:MAG: 3-dehydroquinate synthase [Acholeplasmataceae bacterium]|nr:3-dehydroquinate synthase [Acholeplasmataceae bacterium]
MRLTIQDYEVYVGDKMLNDLPKYIRFAYEDKKLFIITDTTVQSLYENLMKEILIDFELEFVAVAPGEVSKSWKTYQEVIKQLIALGMKRNHMIIALGGGVVGDLAGFVAATLYRGQPYIQIPTTLLAQVDSSIGGKVGIDLPEGKNLVGSFYNPKFVMVDPLFLETLPEREYNQGVAEMIKVGLIRSTHLFNHFKQNDKVTQKQIIQAIVAKREIVNKDPNDQNERMLLNFGHTFGHAIEKKFNYQTYLHGEAISYGMLLAIEFGIEKNATHPKLYGEVLKILLRLGLVKEPFFTRDELKPFINTDKKNTSEGFNFILVRNVGDAIILLLDSGDDL